MSLFEASGKSGAPQRVITPEFIFFEARLGKWTRTKICDFTVGLIPWNHLINSPENNHFISTTAFDPQISDDRGLLGEGISDLSRNLYFNFPSVPGYTKIPCI